MWLVRRLAAAPAQVVTAAPRRRRSSGFSFPSAVKQRTADGGRPLPSAPPPAPGSFPGGRVCRTAASACGSGVSLTVGRRRGGFRERVRSSVGLWMLSQTCTGAAGINALKAQASDPRWAGRRMRRGFGAWPLMAVGPPANSGSRVRPGLRLRAPGSAAVFCSRLPSIVQSFIPQPLLL